MYIRMLLLTLCAGLVLAPAAVGDLNLTGEATKIVFFDGTTLDSAAGLVTVPAGHGGTGNAVTGDQAFVGGGEGNGAEASHAAIGGGYANLITAAGGQGTIAGGQGNAVSGLKGSIGGGLSNAASGSYATIPGGFANAATGSHSFAAGRRAKANHIGSFVWADSKDIDFVSTADYQFSVRATGGVRFVTAIAVGVPTAGATLAPDESSWGTVSARHAKENFQPVDGRAILETLANLPIERWNYKHQSGGVQHIGPMAEDFHEAFGLNGEYSGRITTQDLDGVALAAIQGLNLRLEEKEAELLRLRKINEDILARLDALEAENE